MSYWIAAGLFLLALACAGFFYSLFFKQKLYQVDVRRLTLFGLVSSMIFPLLSLLSFFISETNLKTLYIITLAGMAFLGILFLFLTYELKILPSGRPWWAVILTFFVFSFGGLFFVILTELIVKEHKGFTNSFRDALFFPFLLPLFGYLTAHCWRAIPKLKRTGWIYNKRYRPPNKPFSTIRLRCTFNVSGKEHVDYNPPQYRVGDAFHRVIFQSLLSNAPIRTEIAESDGVTELPIQWILSVEDKDNHRLRKVEPELTFETNGINDGDIIWAVPIKE